MSGKGKVEITREWIAHAVNQAQGVDVPKDASLVGIVYNADRDIYECVFESEKYPETDEGSVVCMAHEIDLEGDE